MTHPVHILLRTAALLAAVAVGGCNFGIDGGESPTTSSSGDNNQSNAKPIYSIGGSISGLTQSGLTLSASGNSVNVASGATTFKLPNLVATGASYSVAATSQPPGQTCVVDDGTGMVAQANVTNVSVKCTTNTYTIGGIITGLNASGLVLMNGADSLTVPIASSAFVLSTKLPMGSAYAVSVQTQPAGLQCQVVNGSGTMPAKAVTNLMVVCGQWIWTSGSDQVGGAADYGSKGVASSSNVPGARSGAVSWIDAMGKLWLFGGSAANGYLNDLWKYDPSTGDWTWMNGSSSANASGVYLTEGSPNPGSVPGARALAAASRDSAGDLWLFGGEGEDSAGATGSLNDLWEFNVTHNEWTWVSGATTAWAAGSAPPNNAPGGRTGAVSWVDSSGDVWVFGGMGTLGLINDLWEFVPGTGWSLILGSQTTANTLGVYGMQGTAAATNLPGSRMQAATTIDGSGNLWLFGGQGLGALGAAGPLNDLWKFDTGLMQWTWVSGWNTPNAAGNYGTSSTTAVVEPGARSAAASAIDASGNLWLFGGNGIDVAGKSGVLNDTWEYDLSASQWIWISGSQSNGQAGSYGSLGVGALGNVPGARSGAVAWVDATGDFWLFGGQGLDSTKTSGTLNDLWQFQP